MSATIRPAKPDPCILPQLPQRSAWDKMHNNLNQTLSSSWAQYLGRSVNMGCYNRSFRSKAKYQSFTRHSSMKLLVTGSSGFVGRYFCSLYGGVPFDDQDGAVDLCDTKRVQSAVATLMPEAVLHLSSSELCGCVLRGPFLHLHCKLTGYT